MTAQSGLFPGTPLIESPVFRAELERMNLSTEEREIAIALNRDGFAVIDFPDPHLDERIVRIRQDLGPVLGIDEGDATKAKLGGPGRIQDAWKTHSDVREIAINEQILDLLSRLYGRPAFPFQTLNFPVGTQQHLHTDSVHFSAIPPRFMCGVWLAMEDIHDDAGPLNYVRGSHKWPLLDNCIIGRKGSGKELASAQLPFHAAWDALIAEHGAEVERFSPRKGRALIWCANLLHGGSPQKDKKLTRWSQVTHYYFDDCVYYTPAHSDEYLGKLALRHVVDIASGKHKPNIYQETLIDAHPEVTPRPSLARRIKRAVSHRKAG